MAMRGIWSIKSGKSSMTNCRCNRRSHKGDVMKINEIKKDLKHRMNMMGSERNKLRALEDELRDQIERYDSALEDLRCCIDKLSEVV